MLLKLYMLITNNSIDIDKNNNNNNNMNNKINSIDYALMKFKKFINCLLNRI